MPELRSVLEMRFINSVLQDVSFPALQSGNIAVTGAVSQLSLPALETGAILASGTTGLQEILAPALLTLTGNVSFVDNQDLQTLDLGSVTQAAHVTVETNPLLTTINMASLTTSNALTISENPLLNDVDVSLLQSATSLTFTNNTAWCVPDRTWGAIAPGPTITGNLCNP